MVFDVFPTIIPAITAPVKPTELTSSDWAKGVEEAISIEFTPTFDEALGVDLAFLSPYSFDLAQILEVTQLNVIAKDLATVIETVYYRELTIYEQALGLDRATSIALEALDSVAGLGLAYVTLHTSDLAIAFEVLTELNILAYDIAIGLEFYTKFLETIDIATGVDVVSSVYTTLYTSDFATIFEVVAVPNILTYDIATGIEIYRLLLETVDSAIGLDVVGSRLFTSYDFAKSVEKAIKSFLVTDYATAIDFGQLMLVTADLAISLERILSRGFILADLATGFDKLIERYLGAIDARLGIDRVIIEFEESCMKVLYFAFGTYGFVHIYSIDNFTPPFVVEAKLSPRTAKGHDARLDLYYPDKLIYHPADAYGSYLHAWGSGDPEGDPFKGLFAWGFRTDTESLLNKSMGKEFHANRWYIFRIIQRPNNTKFQVYGEKRNLLAEAEHTSGHNVDLKIVIGACNEDKQSFWQEVWYDWVFVRKYIEPEPSVSIGSEEKSPVTW